ncbi:trypsin-1-like [Macrobrachium nipponense]|uniref:trypsin-1-like n=1 Tax=Macrobrachium nipponense TaxID=159736 RepID=UPI0030C8470D
MYFLVVFFCFSSVLSSPHWGPRYYRHRRTGIIGGDPASAGELPYQLSLQDTSFGFRFHFCGAVIYDENWGVSAAQCFQGVDPEDPGGIVAVAGELQRDITEGPEQTSRISQFFQHEFFNGFTFSNDVAVFRVSTPFVYNEFVQPIALAPANHTASGNCTISGWGATEEGGVPSESLMRAFLPVLTDAQCRVTYGDALEDSMICAGVPEGGVDACNADTGGPLVCSDLGGPYLAGIASWGRGCGRPDTPGVYCEVSYYVDWIKAHVSQ